MRLFFIAIFLFSATYFSSFERGIIADESILIAEENGELEVAEKEPEYYELVLKRFQPEKDEYYLDGIFSSRGEAFARISRAKGTRASELHQFGATYRVGDYIDEGLEIKEIKLRKRSVIIYDQVKQRYYQLKMSYGTAVSRLTPIADPNHE